MKSSPRSDGSMILQVLGTWKCMTNRYKIDARKRYAKNTENYAKMDPKWKPKSLDKLKRWAKSHQKWEPKKHMIFEKVPVGILFPPDLPKWIQINKITYRRTTKRRQPTADNLQKIIQRLSADRLCARGGRTAVSNANTPRAHSGPVRIFGAVRGVRGAVEFNIRFQKDFFSAFTRRAPQAGCGGWTSMPKWTPKVMPKSTFGRSGVRLLRFWDVFWGVWF